MSRRRRALLQNEASAPFEPIFPKSDYMKLEYVQWGSSPAAFITPIYDDGSYGDIGYEIDLMPVGTQGNYVTALIGTNIWGIRNVDNNYRLSLGGNQYVTLNRQNNVRYYIDADSGTGGITVNGTILGTINHVRNFRNYIVLGGYRQGTTLNPVARNVRVYEYILKKSNGKKIGWFVPAMRLSDKAIGFWDYISNTFITNSGSGTVTAGTYGTIPAQFSVSATDKVYFSQGNLQYHCLGETWRFAEHQYDIVGSANTNISPTYNGWIDLFGWGTSGYNGKVPTMVSTTNSDYGDGNNNIDGTYYDWGVYNAISNGGNQAEMWRTATQSEYNYLINTRSTPSGKRYAKANVNGINGLLLFPDNWDDTIYTINNANTGGANWNSNVISASDFALMESAGVVFIPVAGYRTSTTVNNVTASGFSWSSTKPNINQAYALNFYSGGVQIFNYNRAWGVAVRLIRNI